MQENPLLAPWSGPYGGVPPWDRVQPGLFEPAFASAIAEQRAEVERIAADPTPPDFANTIVALERSGRTLGRVARLFGVYASNLSTAEVQAIERRVGPLLAEAEDQITFNPALYQRIAAVYEARADRSPVEKRLIEKLHDELVRAGARLPDASKGRLSAINQELAACYADFGAKVLADEDSAIALPDEAAFAGLPPALAAAARAAGAQRGLAAGQGAVVNTRSSVDPFLTCSTRRDLRERVWRAFTGRGDHGGASDTNALVARIVALRAERATLLGFASHAHWRMADTMARDPAAAMALMMRVWPAAVARARAEVADMQAVADREGASLTIAPWDYRFYAEKVRRERYALDLGQLEPHFTLENLIQAGFYCARRLHGLCFTEITGTVPVFHPEVRVWEVTDEASGRAVGLFYGDYFARAGKHSGAWAASYRSQRRLDGPILAIGSNNNNFVQAPAGQPVTVSLDDARTLFHELGHAVHGLLQDVEYPTLAGTPRDFVEVPSQLNEHWMLTREVLSRYARHHQTGAALPDELVEQVIRAQRHNQGFATVEYLAAALVDMELHTRPDGVPDPAAFERETLARLGMPAEIAMRHRLPHFLHLFTSDAYSAGYYSYLWSEVMDADAWQAFVEAGSPFDADTAARLRRHLLSDGDSVDRAEAYRRFRGRDPDPRALLAKRGFPSELA
jgi:peptidyl-dipeptidase Dcp